MGAGGISNVKFRGKRRGLLYGCIVDVVKKEEVESYGDGDFEYRIDYCDFVLES